MDASLPPLDTVLEKLPWFRDLTRPHRDEMLREVQSYLKIDTRREQYASLLERWAWNRAQRREVDPLRAASGERYARQLATSHVITGRHSGRDGHRLSFGLARGDAVAVLPRLRARGQGGGIPQ